MRASRRNIAIRLDLGAAEGLHQGEVAAAFEHAGREGGQHADGDGEGDQQDGSVHQGMGLSTMRLSPSTSWRTGSTWRSGTVLMEACDGGFDLGGASGDLKLDDAGLGAGPCGEGGQGDVDAAVLVAAGAETACAVQRDGRVRRR